MLPYMCTCSYVLFILTHALTLKKQNKDLQLLCGTLCKNIRSIRALHASSYKPSMEVYRYLMEVSLEQKRERERKEE